MLYQSLLNQMIKVCRDVFAEKLTGVYLHGSLSMGCFHPQKSDIDFIIVVTDDISDEQKFIFMQEVVELNKQAPDKGLELSVVKREFCEKFLYPTPFELHFSNTHLQWFEKNPHDYINKMKGTDKDLAAHFTIINRFGITLYGDDASAVFSEVPKADYIDSIWFDIEGAKEEILKNPIYVILNLCRVAAYLREELVTSKKQGGEWGLQNLPNEFHELIKDALECYGSDRELVAKRETAKEFAEYMLEKCQEWL